MRDDALLQRIHETMAASGREWSAREIGREFLRLSSDGPAVPGLIRGVLACDARFLESRSGVWTIRSLEETPLRDQPLLLAWVLRPEGARIESWRLHLREWRKDDGASSNPPLVLTCESPDPWVRSRLQWSDLRMATYQPAALRRILRWADQAWAVGEWEDEPIDLSVWAQLALVREGLAPGEAPAAARLPSLAARWSLGPMLEADDGDGLDLLARVLDHLTEAFGAVSDRELASECARVLGSREPDWDRFSFGREQLEAVPDSSGVYRFYARDGALLYVGKAARLSRRVTSYFRPLPPAPSKREELLAQIDRFEYEVVPSELEALIREARWISEERPPWNVQIEIHAPAGYPEAWRWPFCFIAPGGDERRVSAFLLFAPDRGLLLHLPREPQSGLCARLGEWLDAVGAGLAGPEPSVRERPGDRPAAANPLPALADVTAAPVPCLPLRTGEVALALRYLLRHRDGIDRADAVHFAGGASLGEALLDLAAGNPGRGAPVDRRPAAPTP